MFRVVLFVLIAIVYNISHVVASNIPVYDIGSKQVNINDFSLGLLIDSEKELGIDDVAKLSDSFSLVNSRFTIKSIKNNYWFVFRVKNSSSEKVKHVIGFDEVYMESADIYYKIDSGWHHEKNGLSQPIDQRKLQNRCPLFYVTLEPNETKTIYLKLHSRFALVLGLVIESVPVFSRKEQGKIIGYWSYFGAAIAILLYNLFLLFQIRDRVYLYYVIYAACIILFTFLYSGYFQYINTSVKLHYMLHASIALVGVFVSLFTRELLSVKTISLWIDKTLLIISAIYVVIAILIMVDIYFYQWLVLFGMPSMLFLLFVGIYALTKKIPIAKFYVIAMSGYLIGLAMIAAVNLGLIPFNVITRYGFMIGSFIELLVFSLALGYRIRLLQDEKNTYHEKLLNSERIMKEELELLVAKRTEDLSNTVEELNTTNDKLFQLSLFKEDMTNMVVHDLKAPLSTIINVKLIKDDESMLNLVQQSGYNMLNLVQNILDVYKYENTKIELSVKEVELIKVINIALEEVFFLAEQKSLNIKVSKSILCCINADKEIMKRVFVNLLTNAIKFSPSKGEIKIQALVNSDKVVKISVKNQGPGIPIDKQKIIFEKFGQSEKKKSGDLGSTGLGLTFCKMAIEAHGGKIGVISEPDQDVEFWFTLPTSINNSGDSYSVLNDEGEQTFLTKEELGFLRPFITKLKDLKLFQITAIKNMLNDIENRSENIMNWKKQIESCVYSGDDKLYYEKLNSSIK